jgi:hypothetical protein
MSGINTGDNIITYNSLNLSETTTENTPLNERELTFIISGASYISVAGSNPTIIGPGGETGLLYIRDFNRNLTDVVLSVGEGTRTAIFNIVKGVSYDLKLLYTRFPEDFYGPTATDYTIPIPLTIPTLSILPGGYFSVGSQTLTTIGVTAATLSLQNAFYEGLPGGKVATISVYADGNGVTSTGLVSTVTGNLVGTLRYSTPNNASGTISHSLLFDQTPNFWYMVYNIDSNPLNISRNYVGVTGINLPLTLNNFLYKTGTTGVNVTMYNGTYNIKGLTGGDVLNVIDYQGGTSPNDIPMELDSSGIPYASWFFGSTGGTAQVIPGSIVKYRKRNGSIYSNNSVSIPSHRLIEESISGRLNFNSLNYTNTKLTLRLDEFNYFDSDGNSIFNTFQSSSATGTINLVSVYGTTGTIYSGQNSAPTGSGVIFDGLRSYDIEFPDPIPLRAQNLSYRLSFYDAMTNSTKISSKTLNYTWPGRKTFLDIMNTNGLVYTTNAQNVVSLSFVTFDYIGGDGFSIFDATRGTPHTGIIQIYDKDDNLVGTKPYPVTPASSFFIVPTSVTTTTTEFGLTVRFFDNDTQEVLSASQSILIRARGTAPPSNGIMQIGTYKIDPKKRLITIIAFDYTDPFGNAIAFNQGNTGGFLQLLDPNSNIVDEIAVIGAIGQGVAGTYFLRY